MGRNKLYTYEDWWEGNICLVSSPAFYKESEANLLKRAGWSEFKQADILAIKKKQAELFNEQVSERFSALKEHFLKRYEQSKLNEIYLQNQIDMLSHLLLDDHPIADTLIFKKYGLLFENNELEKIQLYIRLHKTEGNPETTDFIHSPKFPFQKTDIIIHQVYAESLFQYLEWLSAFKIKLNADNEESDNNKKIPPEPANPYPGIFINGFAYEMFKKLINLTVKEKTKKADFGFIFFRLKGDDIKAIYKDVRHKTFIDCLKAEGWELKGSKLNSKNQLFKQPTIDSLIKEFSPLIVKTEELKLKNPQN